jgi:hypothetical protein
MKRVGNLQLNLKLYEYYKKNGLQGKIFSKYPYLRYLPVLRDYWAEERDDPGVYYYLETFSRSNKQLVREIKQKLKTGEYTQLFIDGQYLFIKVK